MKGTFNDHLSILRSVPELSLASDATLISLVERCEERSLRQGQTLIRPKNFESHGFVVVSGALRLLAQEPFGKDLFMSIVSQTHPFENSKNETKEKLTYVLYGL